MACDIHPLNNVRVLKYLTQVLGIDAEDRQRWYAHWVAEGLAAAETLLNRHRRGAFFAERRSGHRRVLPGTATGQRPAHGL